jgi:hypothetical protein
MKVRNHHDMWSGVMFGAFGLSFMALSQQYQMGSAAKMGPAYFPTVLGGLMTILGLAISAGSVRATATEGRITPIGWREIVLVVLGVVLFSAALNPLGVVIALIILIFVSAAASHEFSVRDTTIATVVLLIMSYLTFVKGLELQFPVWPAFLTK